MNIAGTVINKRYEIEYLEIAKNSIIGKHYQNLGLKSRLY